MLHSGKGIKIPLSVAVFVLSQAVGVCKGESKQWMAMRIALAPDSEGQRAKMRGQLDPGKELP